MFQNYDKREKKQEKGRSMIEMLGVLAIIGVLSIAGLVGYQQATLKMRVNKAAEAVTYLLRNYADFTIKNLDSINISGTAAVENAKKMGLVETCKTMNSMAESSYTVCSMPLGELYVKLANKGNNKYSYMLYATMVGKGAGACNRFITQGWDNAIPHEWWPNAMVRLISDTQETVVYPEGGAKRTVDELESMCRTTCPESSQYCSLVFDIGLATR